eukprot:3564894-Pyramimonas_sp.AAC.1
MQSLKERGFVFSTEKPKGNPMSGRWDRALKNNAKLRQYYMDAKGYLNKQEFRSTWAKGEYEKWATKHELTKTETHSLEDIKDAEYMSMGRVAWKCGGGRSGNKMAQNYCYQCILMGGI